MRINNQRGTAALEAIPVSILLFVLIAGILLAAYLMFARGWIQYQSEQALLCAAETRTGFLCKSRLDKKLNDFLPWGKSTAQIQAAQDRWSVEVTWKFQNFSFRIVKELTPKQILARKVLQW